MKIRTERGDLIEIPVGDIHTVGVGSKGGWYLTVRKPVLGPSRIGSIPVYKYVSTWVTQATYEQVRVYLKLRGSAAVSGVTS